MHQFLFKLDFGHLVLEFIYKIKPFRLQRLPRPPEVMQARQNVCCKHPCLRRRHRGPNKTWVACILVVAAGTACTAGPADSGLHASVSSPQAPEARQNARWRHHCLRRRRGPDALSFLIRIGIKNDEGLVTEAPRATGGPASWLESIIS